MTHKHSKYGFCKLTERWVPRDDMLGINVKLFDADNSEERVIIRLSPEGWLKMSKVLKLLRWDNVLLTIDQVQSIASENNS